MRTVELCDLTRSVWLPQRPDQWTISVNSSSEDAVVRMHLDDGSRLLVNEKLTVLEEDGSILAVLTKDKDVAWVASPSPSLILEYEQGTNTSSQIQVTLVAYNQSKREQRWQEWRDSWENERQEGCTVGEKGDG